MLCTFPTWQSVATMLSFQIKESGRAIDRMDVRGVELVYVAMQDAKVPFQVFAEVILISPSFMDRVRMLPRLLQCVLQQTLRGTDNKITPAITITGFGFDSTFTYFRCNIQYYKRVVQSSLTYARSSTSLVCRPPQWDLVTKSLRFQTQEENLTVVQSVEGGWSWSTVYSQHSFPLKVVAINRTLGALAARRRRQGR